MFRLKLGIIAIGGLVIYFGIQEFKVSRGASAEPESAEVNYYRL